MMDDVLKPGVQLVTAAHDELTAEPQSLPLQPVPPSGRRICVFCGASVGLDPAFAQAAREVGQWIARLGCGLVYGGGRVGLMGEVAAACRAAGGEVIGVIPQALMDRELGDPNAHRLIVVDSMHTRKKTMADLSDAFVALPGGIGTLEELFEILTWAQLHFHRKPIGMLDVAQFYQPLVRFLDHADALGFLRGGYQHLLHQDEDPVALLKTLIAAMPPQQPAQVDLR